LSATALKILLTGGTGFVGSHLAARLIEDGHSLTLLARGLAGASAADRVHRIMDWHGVGEAARRELRVVEGDLALDSLGLDPADRACLLAETDEIVHCASVTSFAERKRDLLERVNLSGLGRLLDLAAQARHLVAFHHVSTVYAAGRQQGVCREAWADPAAGFHNPYEETKCRAEWMVRERCSALGLRAVVYRPSVVYGHSRTGRSLLFNAVYHPVRSVVFLRDVYLEDIRERRGDRARKIGLSLSPDGTLRMPLQVEANGSGINLVPVDFLTDAFAAIHESDGVSGVFHIVAGAPTPLSDIVAFTSRMFNLSGICVADPAEISGTPRSSLEAAFDRMIEVYRPYMLDRRVFTADRSGPILSGRSLVCPAFTYDVFERCMSYAVKADWGGRNP
jgi:nucleoside-diphosphate-sugar epimerase